MKNDRYYSFMVELYPDDITHVQALDFIITFYDKYAYILHDKDFNDKGEIKKPHYHVMLKFDNARTITSLSKELSIKSNYIEPTKKNYLSGLRYLIHADDKNKYQYGIDEVDGTLKPKLIESLKGDLSEADYILQIMEIIEGLNYIYITDFVKLIASSGLWSYYRRNAYTINQVISEHNYFISNDKIN